VVTVDAPVGWIGARAEFVGPGVIVEGPRGHVVGPGVGVGVGVGVSVGVGVVVPPPPAVRVEVGVPAVIIQGGVRGHGKFKHKKWK